MFITITKNNKRAIFIFIFPSNFVSGDVFPSQKLFPTVIRGDTRMTSTLMRGGELGKGQAKAKCYRIQGVGVGECTGHQIFVFFFKENWICAMNRHYTEPKINILLTRNFPFDCDIRRWSHRLMIPLNCLWGKSNNRTCDQFECDVT